MNFESKLDEMSLGKQLAIFFPVALVGLYFFLGFMRMIGVLFGIEHLMCYEPWVDWWWMWLFR
jgi:hypothetical protein